MNGEVRLIAAEMFFAVWKSRGLVGREINEIEDRFKEDEKKIGRKFHSKYINVNNINKKTQKKAVKNHFKNLI